MIDWIWLIPLLPLIGMAVNGFFGRRMTLKAVGLLACAVVFVSFLIAVGAVWDLSNLPAGDRHHSVDLGSWMPSTLPIRPGHREFVHQTQPNFKLETVHVGRLYPFRHTCTLPLRDVKSARFARLALDLVHVNTGIVFHCTVNGHPEILLYDPPRKKHSRAFSGTG